MINMRQNDLVSNVSDKKKTISTSRFSVGSVKYQKIPEKRRVADKLAASKRQSIKEKATDTEK